MKKLIALAVFAVGLSVNASAEPPAKYSMYCIACHGVGVAGAPKTGDQKAWEERLKAGMDALIASSKKGKGAMPPMGLCQDCTDAELKEIIEFMSK